MLSNFQFGNHALLQSFLIGQPEFRDILQSPHMMQFRQRVIASCHIGPMDVEETAGYIEHRLKCAGAGEWPKIMPDALEAVFKASNGIPRRINAVCDRLLLSGYLGEKREFGASDVEEVAREILEETAGSGPTHVQPPLPLPEQPLATNVDFEISQIISGLTQAPQKQARGRRKQLAAQTQGVNAADLNQLLAGLNAGQFNDRLARVERSLHQLEVINATTLALMHKIFAATSVDNMQNPSEDKPGRVPKAPKEKQ